MRITQAHLVTVPILDARLQELRSEMRLGTQELRSELLVKMSELEAKMERLRSELVRWVFPVMLGNVALSAAANALLNTLK